MSNKKFIKEVGNRLKKRRKELDYTQAQLVEILNRNISPDYDDYISDKQISRVESGHNYTRLDKFVCWCLALGKTPDYFLLGIDNSNDKANNKIQQIYEYLKLCDEEDLNNVLLFVKAIYESNK